MTRNHRPRGWVAPAIAGVAALALAACSSAEYPNSIFTKHTEFNEDVGGLFNILFLFGTLVFKPGTGEANGTPWSQWSKPDVGASSLLPTAGIKTAGSIAVSHG